MRQFPCKFVPVGKNAIGPTTTLRRHPLPTPVGCGSTTWRERPICLFSFSPSEHKQLLCFKRGVGSTLLLNGKDSREMRSCLPLLLSRTENKGRVFFRKGKKPGHCEMKTGWSAMRRLQRITTTHKLG